MAKLSSLSKEQPDYAFEMVCSTIRFGRGVTAEVGQDVKNLQSANTLLVTDKNVANTNAFKETASSLKKYGVKFQVFDDVLIEPTDKSMLKAVEFAKNGRFDCFVAVGGGSVIDTTKTAALYASNPQADFLDFIGPPFGKSKTPENPMLPLIAVPTTAGTGSETTGAAILDLPQHKCKTGIRLRCIKPYLAIIDPLNVFRQAKFSTIFVRINDLKKVNKIQNNFFSMPRNVAIYSGFDVLCHALESYTAISYNQRVPRPTSPAARPLYQGSNPISGMGFGNAGVHLCHGLSYPISSQVSSYYDPDYPRSKALIPHGLSVVTTAVADFELLAPICHERMSEAAKLLGANVSERAKPADVGKYLCDEIRSFMRDFKVPNGLKELGFKKGDIDGLAEAAMHSVPNIAISPTKVDKEIIQSLYEKSISVY
ncbi:hypothetical protein WR25_00010 [Diploscapter pachys]|uniref:hydroxyacid-oxoacid transhydrogenase n=1 Tax=Diploscapter pachys TaxID=2018661 RepID=A0A2A2KE13_9BILA|nr:hypothetical protein WR25_00010 [Diploscapter pachys]